MLLAWFGFYFLLFGFCFYYFSMSVFEREALDSDIKFTIWTHACHGTGGGGLFPGLLFYKHLMAMVIMTLVT